jgi:adenylate cyclase
MTAAIFISHASADAAPAGAICVALEAAGIPCWIAPRNIAAGVEWADAIAAGIAEVRLLLLVHSGATDESLMVRREVTLALARGVALLPVRIDDSLPRDGMQFYLSSTHWLDAFAAGLEANLGRIVAAAEAALAGARLAAAPLEAAFADRPAIAVLPFRAVGEGARELADWLVDDVIGAISAWRVYPVIARGSAAAVAHGKSDMRLVGRLLGARYLVGGSIRLDTSRAMVALELVDAETADVLITEKFAVEVGDPIALVDAAVQKLAAALSPELVRLERERAKARPSVNPSAYELMRQGYWHRHRETRADLETAVSLFEQALALAPNYAPGLSAISLAWNYAAIRRWVADVPGAFAEASAYAQRALAADPRDTQSHLAVGVAHMNLGQRDAAITAFHEAIRLSPSYVMPRANLAQVLNYLDRPNEALTELDVVLRLNPHMSFRYQWLPYIAASHYLAGRFRECLAAAREALEAKPDYPLAVRYVVAALGQMGRADQAEGMLEVVRRTDRDFANLEAMTRRLFVPSAADRILDGFRKAGLG